jgi:hypothetical protein
MVSRILSKTLYLSHDSISNTTVILLTAAHNCDHTIPYAQSHRSTNGQTALACAFERVTIPTLAPTKNKRTATSRSLRHGLYPSPKCTTPNCCLLVERVKRQDARFSGGANASRVDANHCILLSAETTNTGLVDCDRDRLYGVTDIDCTGLCSTTGGE